MKIPEWEKKADQELSKLLRVAQKTGALKRLGPKVPWSIEVTLCGAAKMGSLNLLYRGKNGPTDVLSFEAPPVFQGAGVLGELVICLPVMKSQAKRLGHSELTELRVLLAHGILHLLGLDHEKSPKEARRMAGLEAQLLRKPKGLIHRAQ